MKRAPVFCVLVGLICFNHFDFASEPLSQALPRSTPEAQGVSSSGVLAFLEAADQVDAMNSFMLVRHGQVVAEGWWTPYNAASNHELYSLSKSFTSTAVGMAIADGRLSLDDEVMKFFPEDAPAEPSANLKSMRVRDLLCMSTGNQDETSSAPDKISPKSFLAHPVPHKPGTHFKYNTPATFMLSAIVQKQTGQTVLDYLRPRLFEPLGIANPVWGTNAQGISLGGYGLRVRTEDIAKFGQLYLERGQWKGRQLMPASWVEAATARQTSNGSNPKSDWDQGYGYQFWRCRHNAYRGDGAFGQYCMVLPEQDAVIAITSGVKDMQAVMNLVWDKLLPALQAAPLPVDPSNQKKLEAKLASLAMRTPQGAVTSTRAAKIAGRKFVFPANDQKLESISIIPNATGTSLTLVVQSDGVESRYACGQGEWKNGRGRFGQYTNEPVAASAAWTSDDTLVVKVCAYETPFYSTTTLRFDGDQLVYDRETNVGFGSTKSPQLIGRAE
ncbi:MAG TPA: serine hydrolase [Verrucomicrobiota bacterium]|nr:serine hydrolase [Verrucomicrobiales bacterium]HRI16340.1 serine hydrolase [Verrucomicrobiota bacterium]